MDVIGIRSEKSPLASFFAVELICTSGTHMDFTKYAPVITTTNSINALISRAASIIPEIWSSTSVSDVTNLSAFTLELVVVIIIVTARIFSPPSLP